ncbi:MAG: alpha/beta hydrolase [Thermomicrobiales bacterium]
MTIPRLLLVFGVVLLAASALLRPAIALAQTPTASSALDLRSAIATPNDCSFLIKGDDDPRPRLGEIACGTVDVPENWSQPEGRRLQIAYLILKSTAAQPAPDPVIELGGGPGISPLTFAEAWAGVFATLRQERDVILYDQRGARLSSPLRCDEQSVALAVDAPADATGITPASPAYPAEITDPEAILQQARDIYGPLAAACVAELQAGGANITQYNSLASANDLVALVGALGYDAYNLYGVSYGTRLALEVMRTHPDSGLRSVVLDSTYPPEIPSYEQFPLEPFEPVMQLFVDCARDAACNAAYPNLKARFMALLAQLRATPVTTPDGTTVTDRDLIALLQGIGGNIPVVPYIPRLIAELEQGDTTTWTGIADGSLLAPPAMRVTAERTGNASAEATPVTDALAGFSPARRFVLAVQADLTGANGDDSAALATLRALEVSEPTNAALQAVIDDAFPEAADARAALTADLAAMNGADMQEISGIATQALTLANQTRTRQAVPMYYSVECNERLPFQSFARMVENAQALEIPDLALGIPESFAKVFAICEQWPAGEAPAETQQAVRSDIPTLVLASAYDNLTPISWNKSAFVTLENASFAIVPMAGHGAIAYSACAQQIGAAFIADPAITPDTSCLAGEQPDWALPAG